MRASWTSFFILVVLAMVGCKESGPVAADGGKAVENAPVDRVAAKSGAADVAKKKVVIDAEPVVKIEKKNDAKVVEVARLPSAADSKAAVAAVVQEDTVAVAVAQQGEKVAIAEAPVEGGAAAPTEGVEGTDSAEGVRGADAVDDLKGTEGFAAAVKKGNGEAGGPGALLAPAVAGKPAGSAVMGGGELALGDGGPAAEKSITVAFGSPRQFSGGEFDRKRLRDALAAGPETLGVCFKDELLESDHHSNLNYVLRIQVGAGGKATATLAEDYMGEAKAGACALGIIGGWEFPAAEGGEGGFSITMVVRRS